MGQWFFAYGSFEKNQIHHGKISQFVVNEKRGFLKGRIYRLSCGYPMMDLQAPDQLIEGSLLELKVPNTFWSILDELLGVDGSRPDRGLFQRQEVEILTDNYSKVLSSIYCLNPKKITKRLMTIPDGDWKKDMLANPPIVEHLEDRHKDYIIKLSKTRGRDIVPIKLDLYRELLSLELIVDKGRRLALTPLGKEASFFVQ